MDALRRPDGYGELYAAGLCTRHASALLQGQERIR